MNDRPRALWCVLVTDEHGNEGIGTSTCPEHGTISPLFSVHEHHVPALEMFAREFVDRWRRPAHLVRFDAGEVLQSFGPVQ